MSSECLGSCPSLLSVDMIKTIIKNNLGKMNLFFFLAYAHVDHSSLLREARRNTTNQETRTEAEPIGTAH